jgi:hypothetical protein
MSIFLVVSADCLFVTKGVQQHLSSAIIGVFVSLAVSP